VDSPSWEPEYLAKVSAKIYNSIKNVDPKATWLQMTWMFYYDSHKWSEPRMKAYLKAVPQDKLLLLDYFCDAEEMWKKTESYYGQPFIWCYLGNFGGNSFLAGDLKEVSNRIENTFANAGKNLWGLGSTLEAFDLNPLMYEYVFEKAWMKNDDIDQWIKNWANRRTGRQDEHVQKAWKILQDKVYTHRIVGWDNSLTNARPQITDYNSFQNKYKIWYSNKDLYKAWDEMLQSSDTTHNAYRFDVVNIGRQVMGNYFSELWATFKKAYEEKDPKTMVTTAKIMREILIDTENLLASHQSYLLGNWLVAARKFGLNKDEKLYYQNNARSLITTWGEKGQLLNDYANRSWSGLMGTYYAPRWNMFLDEVIKSSQNGVQFDSENFLEKTSQMEWDWAHCNSEFTTNPTNNTVKISKFLLYKYKTGIEGNNAKNGS
jgi:alpha-N-acetylglucosaminidase